MLREYVILSVKLILFVGIAVNIAHPRQEKTMRIALGMMMISAIMLPLVDIFDENNFKIDIESSSVDSVYEINDSAIKRAFEEGIERYICSEYSLQQGEVAVMSDGFDISSMTAERIYVTLSGSAIYINYRSLEAEISEEFAGGGVCEVELDIR